MKGWREVWEEPAMRVILLVTGLYVGAAVVVALLRFMGSP